MKATKSQPPGKRAKRAGRTGQAKQSAVQEPPLDWGAVLSRTSPGRSRLKYGAGRNVYVQGDPADAVYYLERGKVKLAVSSPDGKEAIIAILDCGEFFGEGCLARQALRVSTVVTMTDCSLVRIEKRLMVRMLRDQHSLSERFVAHLLSRNIRYEENLVDQLFNSSEKRLARILLLLAHFGKNGKSELVLPKISQETLAEMVGTTRSRVSYFMNKFRKLGFIEYNGGLKVHSGLLTVVLHD